MPDNIQIIKNRIGSIISKGNYTGESTTKIKNEDKKIEYIKGITVESSDFYPLYSVQVIEIKI